MQRMWVLGCATEKKGHGQANGTVLDIFKKHIQMVWINDIKCCQNFERFFLIQKDKWLTESWGNFKNKTYNLKEVIYKNKAVTTFLSV